MCDCVCCLSCGYWRDGCVGCIGRLCWRRGSGDLVWNFTFKVFSFDWIVFYCGICFLWVKGVIQVGMFDRIILSIRQQVEKGSKIIWDIFEIPLMIYTVSTKWFIHLAIFGGHVLWRQLWKSWWFIFALVDCLTIGIVSDNFLDCLTIGIVSDNCKCWVVMLTYFERLRFQYHYSTVLIMAPHPYLTLN